MMMKRLFVPLVAAPSVIAFSTPTRTRRPWSTNLKAEQNDRRSLLLGGAVAAAASVFPQWPALAIPMVKTDEFENILRDSGRSIQIVEFAGTSGESITVRLVDGTTFGISDIIDSPTDPRSPLKISAMCRQYKVSTKFVAFDAILATTPKKKKVYMNSIVQKAAEKEVLKIERMKQDEEERLAALYQMETDEAKRSMK
ncbi:hypothetical protein MHU86_24927 [Fragilaria crotonensis]|nr:hypothetical protein MHU86_24927 [Fragilaria crotonensis]